MTRDVSITIRLKYAGEEAEHPPLNYPDAAAVLADEGIKGAFKDGLVTKCIIERAGKRLTGLPFHDMTWERFEKALEPHTQRSGNV